MAILQANELTVELRGSDDLSFKAQSQGTQDTWGHSCQVVCSGWYEVFVDVRRICIDWLGFCAALHFLEALYL